MLWKSSIVVMTTVCVCNAALIAIAQDRVSSAAVKPAVALASVDRIALDSIRRKTIELSEARESPKGTVLICGGGALPRRIREEFHRIGGGTQGSLVLIPTASPRSDSNDFEPWLDYWASFTWKNVEVVHALTRDEASDEQQIAAIRNATAVWVSGGDQRRLSERYLGTPIERELHALLRRGGIIGGTSAGAAIASTTMISGGQIEPQFAVGLSMIPGAIIDQHFSQKRRHARLVSAVKSHPEYVGVGIDESTGLFIDRDTTRVFGDGIVYLMQSESLHDGASHLDLDCKQFQAGDQLSTSELRLLGP